MKLEMVQCPKCGNDFPKKRQELGYHVCVNCSSEKPKVGITTVNGDGDHTYNDILIMDADTATNIARRAATISKNERSANFEDLDLKESTTFKSPTQIVKQLVDFAASVNPHSGQDT